MVVVRIAVVLIVLALGALIGMWMFTADRRYLKMAGRLSKIAIIALGIFFGLMLLERIV